MENRLIRREWTGAWIEPEQEPAWHTPILNFQEMVEAENSGIPSEKELRPVKHLRRILNLENADGELPVKVAAYASAHGVYELYINGKKADDRLLAPETTNYQKMIWYQEYDVTALTADSTVAYIDVLLADGWWIGRLGMAGTSCNYGDRLGFIMDVELTWPDDTVMTIGTDEQYLSCDSFIKYSDLYIGEMQDGTAFDYIAPQNKGVKENSILQEKGDQSQEKTRDSEITTDDLLPQDETRTLPVWTPCVVTDATKDLLAKQLIPGITVIQEIPVQYYVDNPRGELVADFGQVLAGAVRIKVNAQEGCEIVLEHGEVLDRDGNYYSNIKGLYKDQKDRFLCAGGEQTFVPHFTYHGFRYVRISGIEREDILELTALVYSTPLEKIGTFETDNEMLNRFQHAIEASTISNMISVPTDCPQREKLGWTGDINAFVKTGAFLYDLQDFLRSWLLQVRLDQAENGEIPVVVPNHPCQEGMQRGMSGGTNSSAAWSDCCIFIPLNLYRTYGDISFLKENYAAMEKWMAYVKDQAVDDLWIHRFHFGDWLIPSLREEPDGIMRGVRDTSDIVGSCYYSLAAGAMADICRILAEDIEKTSLQQGGGSNDRMPAGDENDSESQDASKSFSYTVEELKQKAEEYSALKVHIDKAITKAYVSADGSVGDAPLQGLYVVVLKTGAADGDLVSVRDLDKPVNGSELKAKMLEKLVDLIEESGYTLDCGFSSIPFLLDVLYDNGRADVAYKLLFSTDAPSWLYMIKNGATTIWENWRAIKEDGTVTDSSYNHYAYGCVGEFMYRHIGGIEALDPGYARVRIAPDLNCGIRRSKCTRKLPQGMITVEWELGGKIRIALPEGVTAELVLPGETAELHAGYEYEFDL